MKRFAVFGAMLLDSDVDTCRDRALKIFAGRLAGLSSAGVEKDAKTRLQEFLQGRGKTLPDYQLVSVTGEDHCQQFTVGCDLPQFGLNMQGDGSSRRRAEQAAAQATLEHIERCD